MCVCVNLATKGMGYYSHWGSNLQTVQCEDGWRGWRYSCELCNSNRSYCTSQPGASEASSECRGAVQPQLSGIKTCGDLSVKSSLGSHGSWGVRGQFTTNQFREMRKEAAERRRGSGEIRESELKTVKRGRQGSTVKQRALGCGEKDIKKILLQFG